MLQAGRCVPPRGPYHVDRPGGGGGLRENTRARPFGADTPRIGRREHASQRDHRLVTAGKMTCSAPRPTGNRLLFGYAFVDANCSTSVLFSGSAIMQAYIYWHEIPGCTGGSCQPLITYFGEVYRLQH